MPELSENEKNLLKQKLYDPHHGHYDIKPGDLVSVKLLHSLLETMKDIQSELKYMRKSNEHLEGLLKSALAPLNSSFGSSDNRKVLMVRKMY